MAATVQVDIRFEILQRGPLRGARDRGLDAGWGLADGARLAAHVELENIGHHDHGLRPVSVFEHGEFQGFGAVDEQATAKASLILNDPLAAAVLADQEERGVGTTRRGRFAFDHDTSPFDSTGDDVGANLSMKGYEFEREAGALS